MPYPETCAGALDAMKQSASRSLIYSNRSLNHMSDAWTHWYVNQDHEAIEDILSALSDTNIAAGYAGYGYAPFDYVGPWWWYFTNCIETAVFDMDTLLSVMLTASDDEYKNFIGLVDAYRVGLWNKPFNAEYYAALARGFASWD